MSFPEGKQLISLHAHKVKEQINMVLRTPKAKLIVDFQGINFVDSSGFSVLLSALKTARENNSYLKLCNIKTDIMELIELMQLNTIFDIQQDVASCLNTFTYED